MPGYFSFQAMDNNSIQKEHQPYPPPMDLDGGGTALLVVDMQNAFLESGGSCARAGLDHEALRVCIPGVQSLVAEARKAGVPVIYTRYVYRSDYLDGGIVTRIMLPVLQELRSLEQNTWDAEINNSVAPRSGEIVVDKNRPGAFHGTPLQSILNGLAVNSLIVCGITTNICVETTIREAMQRDYRCWVVSDATAEFEPDRHFYALKSMAWMFASIVTTDCALQNISALATSP